MSLGAEPRRLPTGVTLDPVAPAHRVGNFPLAMAMAPEGDRIALLLCGWREQGVATRDDPDGFDQVLGWRCFKQKCRRARGQSVEDVLVELEGREDDDARRVGDFARRLDAIDARHPDVHQHDVGALLADDVDRLLAVRGFARDLQVGLGLDDHLEPCPDHGLVVDYGDADQLLTGSVARTLNPPNDDDPVVRSPPNNSTRSRMP